MSLTLILTAFTFDNSLRSAVAVKSFSVNVSTKLRFPLTVTRTVSPSSISYTWLADVITFSFNICTGISKKVRDVVGSVILMITSQNRKATTIETIFRKRLLVSFLFILFAPLPPFQFAFVRNTLGRFFQTQLQRVCINLPIQFAITGKRDKSRLL